MYNRFEVKAEKFASEVNKNGGWLLFMPDVVSKDVLYVLEEKHNIVEYPYEGYSLLWLSTLSEERRKEVLALAKDEVEVHTDRMGRYPFVEWSENSDR